MELLVGRTFTIEVSSSPPPPAYGRDHQKCPEENDLGHRITERPKFLVGDSSESSSSIGTPDDSGDEEGEEEKEEVQSKLNGGLGLGSLDSLQDSLPIKRGLSGHFDGKSKSFTDLTQVSTVNELQKQENPFNKRRRLLMASKWSRRSAFYTWSNPKSMPLLPLVEDEQEEEEKEKYRKLASPSSLSSSSSSSLTEEKKQEDQLLQLRQNRVPESYAAKMRLRLGSFKARSFSLADLQEHDDEEEDE